MHSIEHSLSIHLAQRNRLELEEAEARDVGDMHTALTKQYMVRQIDREIARIGDMLSEVA